MAANKFINIGLAVDNSQLVEGFKESTQIIKTESDKAGKAASDAGGKIENTNKKVVVSQKSLAQEFRAAQKEAQQLAAKYGLMNEAAIEATKAAGKLKNELEDYKSLQSSLGSDAPIFHAIGQGIQVMAGGLSAATGLMGLFGEESEKTQQMILKVQSAMAFAQGIQALAGMQDALVAIAGTIQATVIPALESMVAIMVANPIIAVSVALAAGVIAFAAYTKATEDSTIALRQNGFQTLTYVKQLEVARATLKKLQDEILNKAGFETTGHYKDQLKQLELQNEAKRRGITIDQLQLEKVNEIIAGLEEQYRIAIKSFDTKRVPELEKELSAYKNIRASLEGIAAIQTQIVRAPKMQALQLDTAGMQHAAATLQQQLNKQSIKQLDVKVQKLNMQPVEVYLDWKTMNKSLNELNQQITSSLQSAFSGITTGIGNAIGQAMVNGADLVSSLGQVLLDALGNLLLEMGTAMVAYGIGIQALQAALVLPFNPALALVGGAAMLAAGGAMKAAAAGFGSSGSSGQGSNNSPGDHWSGSRVPMADGAIVYGPTHALVGEYSGARNNPEVIAPLSDLKGILGNMGGFGGGRLMAKISGRDLLILVEQAQKDRRRGG